MFKFVVWFIESSIALKFSHKRGKLSVEVKGQQTLIGEKRLSILYPLKMARGSAYVFEQVLRCLKNISLNHPSSMKEFKAFRFG